MKKAVIISIRPKWCQMIASGEKTIEVRKNRPKLDTPFKCYIYCTAVNTDFGQAIYVMVFHALKEAEKERIAEKKKRKEAPNAP